MGMLVTSALIGLGLAMDCFAVSLAVGATHHAARLKTALVIAGFFGFFQFGMALVGWGLGAGFANHIAAFDHWVAFILLVGIGVRMIIEGVRGSEEGGITPTLAGVTGLAVATSIDSLAVGISFAFLGIFPLLPSVTIGLFSWALSFAGVFSGRQLQHLLGRRVDIIGGVILILIGIRVVLEHVILV